MLSVSEVCLYRLFSWPLCFTGVLWFAKPDWLFMVRWFPVGTLRHSTHLAELVLLKHTNYINSNTVSRVFTRKQSPLTLHFSYSFISV